MGKALLLVAAVVTLAIAFLLLKIGFDGRRAAVRFAALERIDAAWIASTDHLGRAGFMEGSIAAQQPRLEYGFALFFRSQLTGFQKSTSTGAPTPTWRTIDRLLPPLTLETRPDGTTGPERDPARLVDLFGDYRVIFRGSDPVRLSTEELQIGVTERFEGLDPGQPIVVVGTIARTLSGRGIGLAADVVSSGDHADLLSGERASGLFGLIGGTVLLIVSLVLVVLGIKS